jgi:hypothetical protein
MLLDNIKKIQSNPDTAPLCILSPLDCTDERLTTKTPYLISKGIPW